MSTLDALYWVSYSIMWAVTIWALLVLLYYRRRLIAATARVRAAADPDSLENWARWTMLSVTDREGNIAAWTLKQIYDSRIAERVWPDPISVALWHSDPVTSQAWQDEAERMFQTLGVPPTDTPKENGA